MNTILKSALAGGIKGNEPLLFHDGGKGYVRDFYNSIEVGTLNDEVNECFTG